MLKRMVLTTALAVVAVAGVAADVYAQGGRGAAPPDHRSSPPSAPAAWSIRKPARAAANQIILVEGERIKEIGANVTIPAGAEVIDLSRLTVVPGFVDTHTHLAMTYKEIPENNIYYYTYVADSTPLRAIQAASSAMQLLSSGFTVACDTGNNGNYADTALRQAIEQGWIPGPTIIPSGLIISTTGGQFTPTPEMYKGHNIVYPEYLEANSRDEIVKAVRENLLFGAKAIKICLDCKPWGYSVDDIKLFMSEAAKGGAKVHAHVQTRDGAQRAIDAGLHVIVARPADLAGAARADGAEDHLPRQHRHAVHAVSRLGAGAEARRRPAQVRVGEGRAGDLLDRHGLLEREFQERQGRVDEPRRADDQFPADVEGGRHPGEGHAEGADDQRLQGGRCATRISAARSRSATSPTSSPSKGIR